MTHAEKSNRIARLERALAVAREGLTDLRDYAESRKFYADPMIHKGDIMLRVSESLKRTFDAEDCPEVELLPLV